VSLDPQVGQYLENLHKEAFRINAESKLVKDQSVWSPLEQVQKAAEQPPMSVMGSGC
jgi:hypothetical protein